MCTVHYLVANRMKTLSQSDHGDDLAGLKTVFGFSAVRFLFFFTIERNGSRLKCDTKPWKSRCRWSPARGRWTRTAGRSAGVWRCGTRRGRRRTAVPCPVCVSLRRTRTRTTGYASWTSRWRPRRRNNIRRTRWPTAAWSCLRTRNLSSRDLLYNTRGGMAAGLTRLFSGDVFRYFFAVANTWVNRRHENGQYMAGQIGEKRPLERKKKVVLKVAKTRSC